MSSGSTTWILLGLGAVVAVLVLLLALADRSVSPEDVAPSTVTASTAPAMRSSATGPLAVDVGPDRTVDERETVDLRAAVRAPGDARLSYDWTAEGGLGRFEDAHASATSYIAPSVCRDRHCVVLTLTVTSSSGASISDALTLTVRDPLARPWRTPSAGGSCIAGLDRRCDSDARSACPARPAAPCSSPCVVEVAAEGGCPEPAVPCPCDGCGRWGSSWPFGPQAEHPRDRPKPRIGRQYPVSVSEGGTVALVGRIANPACVSACYVWSVDKGRLEDANTLTPSYHAPESHRPGGESATITLSVYDAAGGRSYDQIRLHIDNADDR